MECDQYKPEKGELLNLAIEQILSPYKISPKAKFDISATNLKTGQYFSINGNQPFFMASTYKIAIVVQLLSLVDEGKLSLNKMVKVNLNDIRPGSGYLINNFPYKGLKISVLNLMVLMLQHSDNTAIYS